MSGKWAQRCVDHRWPTRYRRPHADRHRHIGLDRERERESECEEQQAGSEPSDYSLAGDDITSASQSRVIVVSGS